MSEVQAVPPAFGVMIAVQKRCIRIQASDSGGRSSPHFAALLSVEQVADKLRPIGNLDREQDEFAPSKGRLKATNHKWSKESASSSDGEPTGCPHLQPEITILFQGTSYRVAKCRNAFASFGLFAGSRYWWRLSTKPRPR